MAKGIPPAPVRHTLLHVFRADLLAIGIPPAPEEPIP